MSTQHVDDGAWAFALVESRPVRRRRLYARLFLAVWAVLAVWGALVLWNGIVLYRNAHAAQASLERAQSLATSGDVREASRATDDASLQVARARSASDSLSIRLVGMIPLVGNTFDDARHLVRAAGYLSAAATQGVDAYQAVAPGAKTPSALFGGGNINLAELNRVDGVLTAVKGELSSALLEVTAVRGGFWSPLVGGAKSSAETKIVEAQGLIGQAGGALAVAPDLLGATRKRTYLVVSLNPAELRASGGAPLSMFTVSVDKGRLHISKSVDTYSATHGNKAVVWPAVVGNSFWHEPNTSSPLVNANYSPDWPTSGEEIARAYEAQIGGKLDGVIGLDPVVLANFLTRSGPVTVPTFGQVTGANLIQKTLKDSYKTLSVEARRAANAALVDEIAKRLQSGNNIKSAVQAARDGMAGRHLLMYFRVPAAEALLAHYDATGARVVGDGGDLASVFTQNTNASKNDVFQKRRVRQVVTLNSDGSADVVRTISVTNGAPPYEYVKGLSPRTDPGDGYFTAVAGVAVITVAPAKATNVIVTGGIPFERSTPDDAGIPTWIRADALPPGKTLTVTLTYHLPASADGEYSVAVQAQPTVNGEAFELNIKSAMPIRIRGSLPGDFQDESGPGGYRVAGTVSSDVRIVVDQLR